MLLFIGVSRFTESFFLALDRSSWQYKHINSMNTANQRRTKMAVNLAGIPQTMAVDPLTH